MAPVKALDLPILATVSDKQTTLINALKETWKEVPHQYCQAHYLSNAMSPIYEADQHMKTQIRKQVRAKAGKTMRQVQAEARRKAKDGSSELIVTGLAVEPPPGLHEVKAIAEAVQKERKKTAAQENQSPIGKTNTTKVPLDISQENMSSTVAEVRAKMLDTTPIGSSTDIEDNLTRSEISPNIVKGRVLKQTKIGSSNGALSTPNVSLVVKTTTVREPSVSKVSQKMCESTLAIGQNCPDESDDHKNGVSDIRTVSDVREALLGSNVLVHEYRQSGFDVRGKPEISATAVALSRQEMLDQVVEAYAARLRRVLSLSLP